MPTESCIHITDLKLISQIAEPLLQFLIAKAFIRDPVWHVRIAAMKFCPVYAKLLLA